MSNIEGRFQAGEELLYRVGEIDLPVTFLSYGPRMATGSIIADPQTAIVRDANGNFITVRIIDLKNRP